MENIRDIEWFKSDIASEMKGYELDYKFFEEGDFGSLNQVEFNSKNIGGNVDFWGLGWLGIFVWNYETEQELLNVLLEPNQMQEQYNALNHLKQLL